MAVVTVKNDTALIFRDVVLVIGVKRIGELWLQSRITFCDKERIGVVGDIEQLGDIGLTGVATIVNPDIMLVAELIVEVDGGCQIGDIANGIDIDTTIVLNEVRMLRLHKEANVVVVLFLVMTKRQADVVCIVLILREATEVLVKESGK